MTIQPNSIKETGCPDNFTELNGTQINAQTLLVPTLTLIGPDLGISKCLTVEITINEI